MDVISMPQLGETVTEGTVITWLKQPGDAVAVDDSLFEVSTEKVDTEIPSAVAGVLRVQLVEEGDTVPIGAPVAVITATGDEPLDLAELAHTRPMSSATGGAVTDSAEGVGPVDESGSTESVSGSAESGWAPTESPWIPRSEGQSSPTDTDSETVGTDSVQNLRQPAGGVGDGRDAGRQVISPVVRRLLAEHRLTSEEVVGSGRDGRITRADVVAAAARRGSAAERSVGSRPVEVGDDDEVIPFSRSRAATAAHMVESLATAAHALVAVTVDYSSIDAVRGPAGLSYLPFVARAVVDALFEFPHLNASVTEDDQDQRLVVHRDVNLGIAVDVDQEALMVPVVHRADRMRIGELSEAMAELADQARRRRLTGEALSGGTFTITNVGAHGTLVTMPIINQPQVAILSTDGVRMTPVAVPVDDRSWGMAVHPVGNLCLSFDHRAFDGAYAAAFMARLRGILEDRDWASEVGH